jgi:predicted transcriptional regulator
LKQNDSIKRYIDLDELEFNENTLRFLRKKLDDFTIDVFRKIVTQNKVYKGLVKTRLDNYQSMRKRYDAAFLTLEAQGFIEKQEDGTSTPYYITIRGRQLGTLLKNEQLSKGENNL